jgi:hypothetical protein
MKRLIAVLTTSFFLLTAAGAKAQTVADPCASNILAQMAGAYWNFSYMDDDSGTLKPLFQSGAFSKYATCQDKLSVTAGAYMNLYKVEEGKAKHLFQSGAFEHMGFLPNGWFVVSAGAYYNLYNKKGEFVSQSYQGDLAFDKSTIKWFRPFKD